MSDQHTFEARAREDLGEPGKVYLQVPPGLLQDGAVSVDDTVQVAIAAHSDSGEEGAEATSNGLTDDRHRYRVEMPGTRPSDSTTSGRDRRKETTSGPPVSEGDCVSVEIQTRGDEGDGIAKVDGYTVFVPNGDIGDRVTVEITKARENFAFAEIRQGRT